MREERRRQKQLEWERQLDALDAEERARKASLGIVDPEPKPKKEKKPSIFDRFKKKKNEEPSEVEQDDPIIDEEEIDEDPTPVSEDPATDVDPEIDVDPDAEEETESEEGSDSESKGKKKGKPDKKNGGKKPFANLFAKKEAARKKAEAEAAEENKNPKIRLYNALLRAAFSYSEEPVSREGLSKEDVDIVFTAVTGDYPEIFWVYAYYLSSDEVSLVLRCKDANGRVDVKQIERKRKELRHGAKFFTRGITARTDPYKALLTIYRRVILAFDYDDIGLEAKIDEDTTKDDALRSLYNAIVKRKVVCAGYAVAMQYLLQSVGIVCAYVRSERNASGISHAFNILKIGKYCYYLDATWGDPSRTKMGSANRNLVFYNYCCTPFEDFIKTVPADVPNHIPRASLYPNLERFNYKNHEYYRYHNAYLTSYNENEIARIFAEAALAYDKDEMGEFEVGFRCTNSQLLAYVIKNLDTNGKIFEVVSKARELAAKKNKKAAKLLEVRSISRIPHMEAGVVQYFPEPIPKAKKK